MAIPSFQDIMRPLLEHLADGNEHRLQDTIEVLARHFQLTPEERSQLLPNGKHTLFYDRVAWSRWRLFLAKMLEIPRRGVTTITERGKDALRNGPPEITRDYLMSFPEYREALTSARAKSDRTAVDDELADISRDPTIPLVWIEKKSMRSKGEDSEFGVGKMLHSPQRDQRGADIYRYMRDVRPGDHVLHFTDNEAFTGISRVKEPYSERDGLPGIDPQPQYVVPLADYRTLEPPLDRHVIFEAPYREQLAAILKSGHRNLFYNSSIALSQGRYLTPAPVELVRVLNDAYRSIGNRLLIDEAPYTDLTAPTERKQLSFDDLVNTTLLDPDDLREIISSMDGANPSRQLILAGPPGTSKTWVALQMIKHLTGGDARRSQIVQFHPTYSYEQFIEGLRPVVTAGAITFEVVPGIVRRVAEECRRSRDKYFIVIDEINRANLPRVLGELLFLFEYRDRSIDLAYTPDFSLPSNLYFIATMNTADRNIRNMDAAMRRRFDIFTLAPDADVLVKYYADRECEVPDLVDGFLKLNGDLREARDEHHEVGHAFFMRDRLTHAALRNIWERKVQPLIAEYFFDEPSAAFAFRAEKYWPSLGSGDAAEGIED